MRVEDCGCEMRMRDVIHSTLNGSSRDPTGRRLVAAALMTKLMRRTRIGANGGLRSPPAKRAPHFRQAERRSRSPNPHPRISLVPRVHSYATLRA